MGWPMDFCPHFHPSVSSCSCLSPPPPRPLLQLPAAGKAMPATLRSSRPLLPFPGWAQRRSLLPLNCSSHWSTGIRQGSSADRAQVGVRLRGGTEQEPLRRQGGADQREGGWGARGRGEGRVKKGILRKPLTSPPVPPSLLPFRKREDRVGGRDPEGEGAMGCPGLGSPQQLTEGWGGAEPVPQGAS